MLYVGKATNLRQRVRSYFSSDDRRKIGPLLRETQRLAHSVTPDALTVIMWTGAATALYAACCAIVQSDIKKVLAYSTLSQLGYMVAAFGLGGAALTAAEPGEHIRPLLAGAIAVQAMRLQKDPDGVAEGGHTALHAMLASCAPGVAILNIDNGYGAACAAMP